MKVPAEVWTTGSEHGLQTVIDVDTSDYGTEARVEFLRLKGDETFVFYLSPAAAEQLGLALIKVSAYDEIAKQVAS